MWRCWVRQRWRLWGSGEIAGIALPKLSPPSQAMTGSLEINAVITMYDLPSLQDLLATRSSLLDLKTHLIAAQMHSLLRKYRPDQPRVPAGNPDGGQWTEDLASQVPASARTQVAGKWDLSREAECNEQLRLDEELCRAAGSRTCWSLTQPRWAACMKNDYVPTLRF